MPADTRAVVAIAVLLLGFAGSAAGQSRGASPNPALRPKIDCAAMAAKTVPASAIALPTNGAVVAVARLEAGTGPVAIKANFIPEYCFIQGAIKPIDPKAPDILFGIAIPTVWNQQAWQIAGNGADGFIPLLTTIARGMAGSPIGPLDPPHAVPDHRRLCRIRNDSGHQGAATLNIRRDVTPLAPPGRPGPLISEGGRLPPTSTPVGRTAAEAFCSYGWHVEKATTPR